MSINMVKSESTIFNYVYSTIKNKILNLEYRPGKPISVASMAKNLNVSRTPVHDALMKLSNENLIDIFPKSGSRVSLIDLKRTEDERFIRKSLEMNAIKEMFYNYDEACLVEMERCIEEQDKAFKESRIIDTLYWDNRFHFYIFKGIHKEYCFEISNNYSANEYRVRLLAEKVISTTQEAVLQNHRDIISFLRNRNLEAVLQIEEQHLSRISTEIAILVSEYPYLFTSADSTDVPAKLRGKEDYNENFLDTLPSTKQNTL